MRMRTDFPHRVVETENTWIPLSDGTRLAARLWMPEDARERPVPAVLEYLPYRKDDATAAADARRHPYFAGCGYAAVRVDIRGTGSSDGILRGEYLPQEQDDALEVLSWLAGRQWCTGDVGMIGYSWGGFNGLQIAARRPPQLKTVITHASTDDRYLDDCHYMGGCLLGSDMLKWATSMLGYTLQPPDPRFAGERWREIWLERLRDAPALARDWIAHQRRDAFWRQGSVDEDYRAIECPVLVVGGWADAYTNAVPRLMRHLTVPRRGLIGPWGHMLPYAGVPGPAVGFLQEAVRWWDRWLKGIDNGVMDEPFMRVWMQDHVEPAGYHAERPGRWVAIDAWPPAETSTAKYRLSADGRLSVSSGGSPDGAASGDAAEITLPAHEWCGQTAGVWCANGLPDEIATDQRPDDDLSACFTHDSLDGDVEVLGVPVASLTVRPDAERALLAVRLEDVAPDDSSLLVSWGQFNLTRREGHDRTIPLEPGVSVCVEVPLRVCGHRFAAGHRIRLAVSATYWPHAWPSPETPALAVLAGASRLALPVVRRELTPYPANAFAEPEVAALAPPGPPGRGSRTRALRGDESTGAHEIHDVQWHEAHIPSTGATYAERATDTYRIRGGDPLSAEVRCVRETTSTGAGCDWAVSVEAEMTCDAERFHVAERYVAREDGRVIHTTDRTFSVPRDGV